MKRNIKIWLVSIISILLLIGWVLITLYADNNPLAIYVWQLGLGSLAIIGSSLGMLTAKHYSWLKSRVGQGIILLALGLFAWGVGNIAWATSNYFNPNANKEINFATVSTSLLYMAFLPIIILGMIRLAQATGAKYVLKKPKIKYVVIISSLLLLSITCYLLINILGGGMVYFEINSFWELITYLGYPIFDAVNLVIAFSIVILSWNMIGKKLKAPLITIALGFLLLFMSDFVFSYLNETGKNNEGLWSYLLFIPTLLVFSIALIIIDPRSNRKVRPIKLVNVSSHSSTAIMDPPDF
jgi:hypothetical protein